MHLTIFNIGILKLTCFYGIVSSLVVFLVKIRLHTRNQLPCVGGWVVLKANLLLHFGPNHELGFILRLGSS